MIYFDNGASTKRSGSLVEDYIRLLESTSSRSNEKELLRDLEIRISGYLGVSSNTISFVPNSTYALNEIAYHLNSKYSRVYLSTSEHSSNHLIWLSLFKEVEYFNLDSINTHVFTDNPSVISFTSLSNLEGKRVEIDTLRLSDNHVVVVDASQTLQHSIPNLSNSDISFLVFSAHKTYGPNGIGVIYSKDSINLGISSRNYDSISHIYDLDYCAVEAWLLNIDESWRALVNGEARRIEGELSEYFKDNFPINRHLRIINSDTNGCVFLLEVVNKDITSHDFTFALLKKGIIVRPGLSCSWLTDYDPTRVIRLSLNFTNKTSEIDIFFEFLNKFKEEDCF